MQAGVTAPPPAAPGPLARSSKSNSLAMMAAGQLDAGNSNTPSPSPAPSSSWAHSNPASSASTPSPSNGSPGSSAPSSSHSNSGFVVTSRPKSYFPPKVRAEPTIPSHAHSAATLDRAPSTSQQPASSFSANTAPETASRSTSLRARRESSPPCLSQSPGGSVISPSAAHGASTEPKTTLTLSSSIDSKGRRMVNQYIRLKTIGQGSHGKVWLCAEPSLRESDEEGDSPEGSQDSGHLARAISAGSRSSGKAKADPLDALLHEEFGDVIYCAIKSVARDGPGRGKSLRAAKHRKATGSSNGSDGSGAGIGQDDKVKREVAIMKRLDHTNVVRLKEVIDDVKSKKVFMVLEFMAGGQIVWQDEFKQPTMTVDEARRTFRDVVLGLEYLHYQGIIHRDIKPANLLWTEDHSVVKISDFGVSHVSDALLRATPDGHGGDDDKALRKTAGSPAFFAPELCHPAEYNAKTPTPRPGSNLDGGEYFSASDRASSRGSTPSASSAPRFISAPLASPDPAQPRKRPTIGKGIDIWALGITLYCLLFGDTPFMAHTEYELYNMIVKESLAVPQRMGREGAWTGVDPGWEGCGDGIEGREVVDLLAGLLQKDPAKRMSLEQVKKHPWVLRNLSAPENWLHETDPGMSDTVIVTEEDLEQATQERGTIDALPQIRNRRGLRRALNAALVRFPAFSRVKGSQKDNGSVRSRSKSASSTGHSNAGGSSEGPSRHHSELSRNPSDAASASHKKVSSEFGNDARRTASAAPDPLAQRGTSANPLSSGAYPVSSARGGWAAKQRPSSKPRSEPPSPALPELARSVSATSMSGGARRRYLFARKDSEGDTAHSPRGARAESPAPARALASDVDNGGGGGGRGTFSRILSRFAGGGSGRSTPRSPRERTSSTSDDESLPAPIGDPLRRSMPAPASFHDSRGMFTNQRTTQSAFDVFNGYEEEDLVDTSDYSTDDDDDADDELLDGPQAHADGVSGWTSTFQPTYVVSEKGLESALLEDEEEKKIPAIFSLDNSTPRAAAVAHSLTRGLDPNPSFTPPPLVRQLSSSDSTPRAPSFRDGSIRSGVEPTPGRKWEVYHDEETGQPVEWDDDDGQEIFLAPTPRRKRAPTLVD